MTQYNVHKERPRKVEEPGQANHKVEHIIRVVGTDGLLYDIHMTEAQLKEARRLARYSGYNQRKQSFHDLIVAFLDGGALSARTQRFAGEMLEIEHLIAGEGRTRA
ncbi:MAG TPA: hypothetical protein VL485_07925 [Ktedonobacteraceae bacterium]|jgi:hypothetical protein|nr:hypothetical protein [Ktedonobacteraceae bacterium]